MKKLLFLCAAALTFVGCSDNGSETTAAGKTVAITQIVEHPALDAAREGVKDALAERGFIEGDTLTWVYENAQGNGPNTVAIAKKFVGLAPDAIVAIATPSAQAIKAETDTIPHIFSAVTDPVGAGLVENADNPGGNTTGVSDLSPMHLHIGLIQAFLPDVKRIGIIYNAGEANSKTLVRLAKAYAEQNGIEIVEATAARSAEVLSAARSLIGKVDAIYVPTDNTVISAFESVVQAGTEGQVPVFAGDTDSVARGAVAAVGFDYYDVGQQTGHIVADILEGTAPGSIAVQFVQTVNLHINNTAAAAMGVSVPDSILPDVVADTVIVE